MKKLALQRADFQDIDYVGEVIANFLCVSTSRCNHYNYIGNKSQILFCAPSGNAEGRQSGKTTVVFTLQSNLFHLVNRG